MKTGRLSLTRKPRERIHIGPDVVVHFVSCDGSKMKVVIEAPTGVEVLRGELVDEAKRREKESQDR